MSVHDTMSCTMQAPCCTLLHFLIMVICVSLSHMQVQLWPSPLLVVVLLPPTKTWPRRRCWPLRGAMVVGVGWWQLAWEAGCVLSSIQPHFPCITACVQLAGHACCTPAQRMHATESDRTTTVALPPAVFAQPCLLFCCPSLAGIMLGVTYNIRQLVAAQAMAKAKQQV